MTGWRFNHAFGFENLKIVELPELSPKPGEVVVAVRACSVNYRDLVVARGGYGRSVQPPVVPLSDGAGEVLSVGAGVTRVKPGDRVAGIFMQGWLEGPPDGRKAASALGAGLAGMLAEQVCLNSEGLVHLPDHLSYEEGACLPCAGVTAWNALFRSGGLRAGETVLVLGTGGVSIFAAQFAQMAGARVIATSGSDSKLERLRQMGVSDPINYRRDPNWGKTVRDMTGGVGVDHVVEVGGAGTLPNSVRAARHGGHIALIGVLARGEFDPYPIVQKAIRMSGILVGSREMFVEMNRAVSLGVMHPVIDRVFPFEEAVEAMTYLASGAHFGKVCIRM